MHACEYSHREMGWGLNSNCKIIYLKIIIKHRTQWVVTILNDVGRPCFYVFFSLVN